MQADVGFLNHVQAGRLLTQAGPLRNTVSTYTFVLGLSYIWALWPS
jgi:hypothetical protein